MGSLPSGSVAAILILFLYSIVLLFADIWATLASGYELGNRRRFVAVVKLEITMTLFNIFMFYQMMHYFDTDINCSKTERRRLMVIRQRCAIGLIIFMFAAQMIYFMYYSPTWLQYIFFDVTTMCAGIWTNLLAFVCGFFIVNVFREPFLKFAPTRYVIEFLSRVGYLKDLIYERKSQIKFAICSTLIMSFLMWYGCDRIMIKERTINIKNFSAPSGSLKLAFVSDIHAGASVYREQVSLVVDKLLSLEVDAVAIVGDMVDGPYSVLRNRVEPFWQVARRFPTYFVTGNHDYYYGDVMEWIDLYERNGIHVLQNNHTMIKGVCLAGVNDISSGKMGIRDHYMNASTALRACPKSSSRVLLSHNPSAALDIPQEDLQTVDLMLSGHTHAGQFYVVVPMVYWMMPYYYGLYDLPYGKLFVSAGTLYQGPNMKMLGMSEIWIFNLVKG